MKQIFRYLMYIQYFIKIIWIVPFQRYHLASQFGIQSDMITFIMTMGVHNSHTDFKASRSVIDVINYIMDYFNKRIRILWILVQYMYLNNVQSVSLIPALQTFVPLYLSLDK